jgi:hypothetical protein
MAQSNLLEQLLNGTAPTNLRVLIARGAVPVPTADILPMLVFLLRDSDAEISSRADQTLRSLDKGELSTCLESPDCAPSVLEYFAANETDESILQAIIGNPAVSEKTIEALAAVLPARLLEKVLDNRVRILEAPAILESVKNNPNATAEIRRLVREIEAEFFGDKKKEYAIEESVEPVDAVSPEPVLPLESEILPDDLSLEGLPVDPEERQSEINKRLATMSVREKIKYALFGNREIRAVLVRDTNKEVSRAVLKSPKLTDNEIETISAMRAIADDILREIGNSKEWTRNYAVVQNLVRNPKTPPAISQRLLFRLRKQDLALLTRDRSIPDAVRHNASRAFNQRAKGSQ